MSEDLLELLGSEQTHDESLHICPCPACRQIVGIDTRKARPAVAGACQTDA